MSKRFSRRRISVADGPGEGDIGSSHLTSSIEGNAAGVKDASNRDTEEIDMKKISACGGEHHESPEEIISLESSLHPSLVLTPEDSACEGDVLDISLMLASNQKLFFKNFCEEFTAVKDVKKFLRRPTLLLALRETSLQGIVDAMLTKMIADHDSESIDFQEARMAFFTHDSVHCLSHVIQGTEISEGGGWEETQNWLVAMAELPSVQQHCVAIAQLRNPVNLGRTLQETHLVVLVLAPSKTKTTQSSLETGRTFATLLSDMETRRLLLEADTEEEFKNVLLDRKEELSSEIHRREKAKETERTTNSRTLFIRAKEDKSHLCAFGRELVKDLKRRWPHYASDYTDGIKGRHTLSKLISTTLFLYFACLLPSIAFGVLNDRNTHGMIDVQKVIISQSVGGVFFAIFGGQPLIVLLTTAPLALYIKVIYSIAADFELDFFALYSCTGLWNSFFLLVYSTFGLSKIMKWSTRSTEEIFALFISLAFIVDAVGSIVKEYSNLHCSTPVSWNSSASPLNLSTVNCSHITDGSVCHREGGLAYAVVSFGTVCIGLLLYNSRKSPFLDAGKREALADYALAAAVLIMSLFASYFVRDIDRYKFNAESSGALRIAPLGKLTWGAVFAGCGLGFSLSLLFFMDQNISSAMVNNPRNRLKKGCAYHLDLLVVAVLNGLLSLFGLPWLHAALPHSPLHVRALADVEERVDRGHVFENIVKVRETRLSGLLSNILIALSLLMLPTPLTLIPTSVLDGLFLFVAITSLYGNQMFERALLLFTEQCAYPPNHYIRHVPERKIHLYTAFQFLQLAVLCGFGFAPIPYLKMVFPVLLMLILPVRQLLVPKIILSKYLDALDAHL